MLRCEPICFTSIFIFYTREVGAGTVHMSRGVAHHYLSIPTILYDAKACHLVVTKCEITMMIMVSVPTFPYRLVYCSSFCTRIALSGHGVAPWRGRGVRLIFSYRFTESRTEIAPWLLIVFVLESGATERAGPPRWISTISINYDNHESFVSCLSWPARVYDLNNDYVSSRLLI